MKLERKEIEEALENFEMYTTFDRPLVDIINELCNIQNKYPNYVKFRLSPERTYSDDEVSLQLYGSRMETDLEFEQRKKRSEASKKSSKKAKANKQAKELALFERLKRKYEK